MADERQDRSIAARPDADHVRTAGRNLADVGFVAQPFEVVGHPLGNGAFPSGVVPFAVEGVDAR